MIATEESPDLETAIAALDKIGVEVCRQLQEKLAAGGFVESGVYNLIDDLLKLRDGALVVSRVRSC